MPNDPGKLAAWAATASDDEIYERLAQSVVSASGTLDPRRLRDLGRAWFQENQDSFREAACPTIRLLIGSDSDMVTAIAVVAGILVGVAHEALVAALYAAALLFRKALEGYCDGVV